MPTRPRPPATLAEALSVKIREWNTRHGWSQRKFAERAGMTQPGLSYWLQLKRRAQGLDQYQTIAAVFGVPLSVMIADLEQRILPRGHAALTRGERRQQLQRLLDEHEAMTACLRANLLALFDEGD